MQYGDQTVVTVEIDADLGTAVWRVGSQPPSFAFTEVSGPVALTVSTQDMEDSVTILGYEGETVSVVAEGVVPKAVSEDKSRSRIGWKVSIQDANMIYRCRNVGGKDDAWWPRKQWQQFGGEDWCSGEILAGWKAKGVEPCAGMTGKVVHVWHEAVWTGELQICLVQIGDAPNEIYVPIESRGLEWLEPSDAKDDIVAPSALSVPAEPTPTLLRPSFDVFIKKVLSQVPTPTVEEVLVLNETIVSAVLTRRIVSVSPPLIST